MTNMNNNNKKIYKLVVRGTEMYLDIRRVSREFTDYWLKKDMDALVSHIACSNDDEREPIDPKYQYPVCDYPDCLVSEMGFSEIDKVGTSNYLLI